MMLQSKKYYLTNGLLLILAIVSFYSWYQFKTTANKNPETAAIDAFAIDIQATQFNVWGQKRGEIRTPKVVHFSAGDSSVLTTPSVTLYSQNNKAPWIISSQTGKTFDGTKKIDLINNVVIHQPQGNHNTDTTITTSLLHIFPKDQLANTNQLVTLIQPGIKITSMGMNAYLDQKRVTLLSQARGLYDPKKAPSTNTPSVF